MDWPAVDALGERMPMLQGRMLQGQCSCEAWCGWAPGYDENCYQAPHCCACDECIERGVKSPKWWDPNSNYGDRWHADGWAR